MPLVLRVAWDTRHCLRGPDHRTEFRSLANFPHTVFILTTYCASFFGAAARAHPAVENTAQQQFGGAEECLRQPAKPELPESPRRGRAGTRRRVGRVGAVRRGRTVGAEFQHMLLRKEL